MMKTLFFVLVVWSCGMASSLAGPMFNRVAAFQAGPLGPENGTLLKHTDGFFYGTSKSGGAFGNGCLYRVSSTGQITALVHFTGSAGAARGRRPQSGLVADGLGTLWGTTFQGGAGNSGDGFGTVFRFNPVSGDFTSVVEFSGTGGFAKGSFPQAGLVTDGAGQLWGTTSAGGAGGHGTVFRINASNLVFTHVLDFTGTAGANRGRNPLAALVRDGAGLLWGTTAEGGSGGSGTLFSINIATSGLTTRVDFTGTTGAFPGSAPAAALREGASGTWWGTTRAGGGSGFGTVFTFRQEGSVFTKIADFTGSAGALPGQAPASVLAPDGAGGFFGTTNAGGAGDLGTVFRVNGTTAAVSSFAAFSGTAGAIPGAVPHAGLVPDGAGFLWGVTSGGGLSGQGVVYKITAASGLYVPVTDFLRTLGTASGSNPAAGLAEGLAEGSNGLLWGSTQGGGGGDAGTLFTVDRTTGVMQEILAFTGVGGTAKGSVPSGELVSDGAGHFWGVTRAGGVNDFGVIFKINELTRVYTVVFEFAGGNGRNPRGRLTADGAGNFWGTTSEGGSGARGTIFKIGIADGLLTTMTHFTGTTGSFPGDGPSAGLTADGTGFLWGVTYEGGAFNRGTLFRISTTNGVFTSMVAFDGDGSFPGDGPSSSLTLDQDGFLWGVTESGGSDDLGVVFKINRSTGVFTGLVNFSGVGGFHPGSNPKSSLIQDRVGAWYGTTEAGGDFDRGTIFKITPAGEFSTITQFTGSLGNAAGKGPQGKLLPHADGHFYGITYSGGALDDVTPAGNGSIYRLRFGPLVETGPATSIESTTATLNGYVNPNGAASVVTFEYGTSATLAGAVSVAGGTTAAVSSQLNATAALTGLQPGRLYFYRIRAVNPENANPQIGGIGSFTTAGTPVGGGGFGAWLTAAGVSGGAAEAGPDSDFDGTPNALEYIQGTSPVVRTPRMDPDFAVIDGHLVLTFQRVDSSETPDVTLLVEAGPGLGAWPDVFIIRATTETSAGGVNVAENDDAPDTITVRIPMVGKPVQYARLRVVVAP